MVFDRSKLPDDIEEMKDLYMEAVAKYKVLNHMMFGRQSERIPPINPDQLSLFGNEDSDEEHEQSSPESQEEITIPEHRRKRGGRKALPEHLPRVEVVLELAEEDKICGCGCQREIIRYETTEKLDIIPEQFRVIEYKRPVAACKNCEGVEDEGGAIRIAPPAPSIHPKSIATNALLAYIIYSKFVEALPLYRLEQHFSRKGVEVSRANMANWTIAVANAVRALYNLLRDHVLASDIINADETRHKVLEELKRNNETQWCQMWVFLRNNGTYPVVYYQYEDSRSKAVPIEFFRDYTGYIQTDAFDSYDFLDEKEGTVHLHCWAHARRYFMKVLQSLEGKNKKGSKKKKTRKSGLVDAALKYIQGIYKIEKEVRGKPPAEIYAARQTKTKPLLKEFHEWLITHQSSTPPSGYLGTAINYCLRHWTNLNHFLDDGRLLPDNNSVERSIRPFVVGRKNWMFSESVEGAEASAIIYSLVETAKANGLDPHKYFLYIFDKVPQAKTADDLEALLPWALTQEQIV